LRYLLDANTFIQAHRTYYNMHICPGYWEWLEQQCTQGHLISIDFVQQELVDGNDELAEWAKDQDELFLEVNDDETQTEFSHIAAHVMTLNHMRPGTHEEFLGCADPWLIAKAITLPDVTVVTHETFDRDIRKKIKLPNICDDFGILYINTFELLARLEAEFVLSQNKD
jgi:hypothetical protein